MKKMNKNHVPTLVTRPNQLNYLFSIPARPNNFYCANKFFMGVAILQHDLQSHGLGSLMNVASTIDNINTLRLYIIYASTKYLFVF